MLEGEIENIKEIVKHGAVGVEIVLFVPKLPHQLPHEQEHQTQSRLSEFKMLHLGKCDIEQR